MNQQSGTIERVKNMIAQSENIVVLLGIGAVIESGGENIYPVQIEDFIRTNEAVHDVAVIGIPDKRLGEVSCAIIELKKDYVITEDEMNEFCMALPRYKRPHKIIFADIPRNPTGKIEKPKLRELYGGKGLVEAQNLG